MNGRVHRNDNFIWVGSSSPIDIWDSHAFFFMLFWNGQYLHNWFIWVGNQSIGCHYLLKVIYLIVFYYPIIWILLNLVEIVFANSIWIFRFQNITHSITQFPSMLFLLLMFEINKHWNKNGSKCKYFCMQLKILFAKWRPFSFCPQCVKYCLTRQWLWDSLSRLLLMSIFVLFNTISMDSCSMQPCTCQH